MWSDCFLKEQNLEFALADYEQALEMTTPSDDPCPPSNPAVDLSPSSLDDNPADKLLCVAIKSRIAVVYHYIGNQQFAAKNFQVFMFTYFAILRR